MKLCRIIDESRLDLEIGFVFYYEKSKALQLEISPLVTENEAPLFLASFIRKGKLSLGHEWSTRWAEQRIVPSDRQNLGGILRENKLNEYDVWKLLMLGHGRCAQDDCAVVPAKMEDIPGWLRERMDHRIEFALEIRPAEFILIYHDGSIWITSIEEVKTERRLRYYMSSVGYNTNVLAPGGCAVSVGGDEEITSEELYGKGTRLPFTRKEFEHVIKNYALTAAESSAELGCSRQYINQLTNEGRLSVLKDSAGCKLYSHPEIIKVKE